MIPTSRMEGEIQLVCIPSITYRLLRVGTSADPAEIKQAFRRLALKLHPDVNSAADAGERFSEVSNAYGESLPFLLSRSVQDTLCKECVIVYLTEGFHRAP